MIDDTTLAAWERDHAPCSWALPEEPCRFCAALREIRRLREEAAKHTTCIEEAQADALAVAERENELHAQKDATLAAHQAVVRAAEAYLDAQDDRLKAMIAKPKDVEQPSWLDHIRRLRTKLLDALVHPLVVAARTEGRDGK